MTAHLDAENTYQPLSKLLGILASPWTLLLLHRLHVQGPTRFGLLRRRLGKISTKTLTERLRLLEAEGWVSRHYEPTVPPQVTYALKPRVMELEPVMEELDRIAERWYGKAPPSKPRPSKPRPTEPHPAGRRMASRRSKG